MQCSVLQCLSEHWLVVYMELYRHIFVCVADIHTFRVWSALRWQHVFCPLHWLNRLVCWSTILVFLVSVPFPFISTSFHFSLFLPKKGLLITFIPLILRFLLDSSHLIWYLLSWVGLLITFIPLIICFLLDSSHLIWYLLSWVVMYQLHLYTSWHAVTRRSRWLSLYNECII